MGDADKPSPIRPIRVSESVDGHVTRYYADGSAATYMKDGELQVAHPRKKGLFGPKTPKEGWAAEIDAARHTGPRKR